MPLYEYRCSGCRRRSTLLARSMAEDFHPTCPHCGSSEMERLISRFTLVRSADSRLDALGEQAAYEVDENDPRSVARWARSMGQELGEDPDPEWEETLARMEEGEMPDDEGPDDFGGDLDGLDFDGDS